MHPALKFLLVAVPALFIGDRLGALALHEVVEKSRDRYVEMYLGKSPAEVVVIGNSRAADQFPPSLMRKKLGVRVVNLGLGGVSMVLNEVLFRDYVEHNGRPRLLVIEPTNLTVDPSGIGDMRLFTIFSRRMEALVLEREPYHYYAQRIFHLFRYNNENLVRVLYGVVRAPEDRLHHGSITPELVRIVKERGKSRLTNSAANEAAFERILAFAREQRIEVAIVSSPYLKEQLENVRNYREWYAWLEARAGGGVKVWDYAALFDDPRFFKDSVHMNADGSVALLDAMLKDGVFGALGERGRAPGSAAP